jgi:hypothetical protein
VSLAESVFMVAAVALTTLLLDRITNTLGRIATALEKANSDREAVPSTKGVEHGQ